LKAYLIRRLLLTIPTFLGISLITFTLIQATPGSPVYMMLQAGSGEMGTDAATAEIVERTKELYGLDKPVPVQYFLWLGRLAQLDFGTSYKDQRPVLERIGETLPITLQLSVISIFLTYLIAIPIGVFSATHQRSWADYGITLVLFLLYSLPSFWVAMLLIMYLGGGSYWDVFPVNGLNSLGAEQMGWGEWLVDRAWHMVLPVFCFTYAGLAAISRYMRTGMLETVRQDYIRTARAYGFSEKTVIFKYAMRNSLIPIVTILGSILPALIGGSVIIETIFSIPGMGRLMFEAMLSRDYPLIMGVTTFSALLTLAGLIITDITYALVDPKIKLD
jgi:peptide/nickel transport system permease protein